MALLTLWYQIVFSLAVGLPGCHPHYNVSDYFQNG